MKRFLPFLSGVLLLAACGTVGPNFERPKFSGPERYMAGEELLTSEQRVEVGRQVEAEWWTLFRSDPLDRTIREAMANNGGIAVAKAVLAQAQETVRAERGGAWPELSLRADVGRQKYGVALFGPLDFSVPPFTYYEIGPALTWTPDWWGAERRKVELRAAQAEYQRHELDAACVTLSANVTGEALALAAAQAEIDVIERVIAEDRKTLELVNGSFEAGAGNRLEVLATQSQLANDLARLPVLRQRQSVARHALAILAGKAPAEWPAPAFALDGFALPAELPLELPSELVRKRPDILAAEANLHAASAAIGVATANLYPHLTLSANVLQEALTPRGLFEASGNAWAEAASVTAPLFNGGRLKAQQRAAGQAYQAALARYRQVILRAFGQVADALAALQHDAEAVAAEQKAVDAAGAALALARESYRAGNTGLLPIEDAQRRQAIAELELVQARSRRLGDTAQLFVALAGSPLPGGAARN